MVKIPKTFSLASYTFLLNGGLTVNNIVLNIMNKISSLPVWQS